jgi:hypothetical protein
MLNRFVRSLGLFPGDARIDGINFGLNFFLPKFSIGLFGLGLFGFGLGFFGLGFRLSVFMPTMTFSCPNACVMAFFKGKRPPFIQ